MKFVMQKVATLKTMCPKKQFQAAMIGAIALLAGVTLSMIIRF